MTAPVLARTDRGRVVLTQPTQPDPTPVKPRRDREAFCKCGHLQGQHPDDGACAATLPDACSCHGFRYGTRSDYAGLVPSEVPVTEWAVRWSDGTVDACANENGARLVAEMLDDATVVHRTIVPSPWQDTTAPLGRNRAW